MIEPVAPLRPAIAVTSAGSGFRWWADSFTWLFGDIARLGVWVGMLLCFFLMLTPLHWFAVIGWIASHLLWFVFSGGLMIAARNTQRGQVPRFGELFAGFGPQAGALVGAGMLVLLASMAVAALMLAIGLGAAIGSFASTTSLQELTAHPPELTGIGAGTAVLLLLCLLLFVPITMAAWLAPALIMLRGAGALDALRWSWEACRRNLGALTVYGLVGVGLAVLATLMVLVGWLLLVPLAFLSTYAAYRELFAADVDIEQPPAAPSAG